jgi:hypothetical protein
MPVISSAARLKKVIRQSKSTVNTPSEMLSRIASVGAVNTGPWFSFVLPITIYRPEAPLSCGGKPDVF